ncbi:TonB-dependent receptor [Poritiphilus flavus]|uniref:TonB-dependent receptor plug domain-containing protein n=1 Tax=Poritiphilus flavus TaxID=2697053 RepID=A0A6L9E9A3_9FLAO|nr:TonB-dependent receptor plug domain-containing protein [Poritiphilus flavus]NAS11138.1 TonB-dependent receptor plug domain-containing protein [Poritiphilus flavus]
MDNFQNILSDSLVHLKERTTLHIANPYLGNSKDLFFKCYHLTGVDQKRYSLSTVLIVELLNSKGDIIQSQFHEIINGVVDGYLELPKDIHPGKYNLKAYTRWMQNFDEDLIAQQEIFVGYPTSDELKADNTSNITIVSEGGTILSEFKNKLIIQLPSSDTRSYPKASKILDDMNREVATAQNFSPGIASADLKPKKDRKYYLQLDDGSVHKIPDAETRGYLLQVNNLDVEKVKIEIAAARESAKSNIKLVGESGGVNYFESQLDLKENKTLKLEFQKKNFPSGIFTLKLMDEAGTELARRPIWIDTRKLNIHLEPVSSGSDTNTFKIKVTDKSNAPVKTSLAVSVNHTDFAKDHAVRRSLTDEDNSSIDRKERFQKDLEIQLHQAIPENNTPGENQIGSTLKHKIQKGLELKGYAYDLDNNLLGNTKIQIMAKTKDEIWLKEVQTDADGLLSLEELQFYGDANLILRTSGEESKSRRVKLINTKDLQKEEAGSGPSSDAKEPEYAESIELAAKSKSTDDIALETGETDELIELQEVELNKDQPKERKNTPSVYGVEVIKSRITYQNPKRPRSIAQMISEIPGVMVFGNFDFAPSVRLLSTSGPILFVLDGFPLAQEDQGLSLGGPVRTSLNGIMGLVSAIDIERIELLTGPEASMYGTRAAGGVISIHTRTGKDRESSSKRKGQMSFKGFEPLVDFKPDRRKLSKKRKEKSNLLFWSPDLETNEEGEAIIEVPKFSESSILRIEASAVTVDGQMGSINVYR